MAKDTFWFKHDSNASRDPKIMAMRSVYGYAGYGVFWALIEAMREQSDYRLNIGGKYGIQALAGILAIEKDVLEPMINDFVNEFDLLTIEDGFLFSKSLIDRMKKWDSNRENGTKGGRPKTQIKPNENPNETQTKPKLEFGLTQPKPLREEKRREDEKRVEKIRHTQVDPLSPVIGEIVAFLNSQTGQSYRPETESTRKLIKARLNEKFTIENFKTVILKKAAEWKGTDHAKYLRPETLFGNKFEGYLNQVIIPPSGNNNQNPNVNQSGSGLKSNIHDYSK